MIYCLLSFISSSHGGFSLFLEAAFTSLLFLVLLSSLKQRPPIFWQFSYYYKRFICGVNKRCKGILYNLRIEINEDICNHLSGRSEIIECSSPLYDCLLGTHRPFVNFNRF